LSIVFVGGYARSGSTLLDRLLGQVPGFESVGEVRHIWHRSFHENQLCGCGRPFRECPYWQVVVEHAYGGFAGIDVNAVRRAKQHVDSFVNIPRILAGGWTASYRRRMAAYIEALGPLYRGIQAVSGAQFVVDSTKDPQHAYILRTIPGFDVRIVHLVRDSRAVAFSWRRVRSRPEVHWQQKAMPRYPVARTALAWNLTNRAVEAARSRQMEYVRVRYEDLVADPRRELTRIMECLDLGPAKFPFLEGGKANLQTGHTVSGNPVRFQTGVVELVSDDEWMRSMGGFRRGLVTVLTSRLLHRYGYLDDRTAGRSRPRSDHAPGDVHPDGR